jgi:hypothetical protein
MTFREYQKAGDRFIAGMQRFIVKVYGPPSYMVKNKDLLIYGDPETKYIAKLFAGQNR